MISQEEMVAALVATRDGTEDIIKQVDMEAIVHADSGWRVRDVIGHLTTWDVEAGKALRAHAAGDVYQSAGRDIEGFNAICYEQYAALSIDTLLDAFAAAHQEFVAAMGDLPEHTLELRIDLPWGGRHAVEYLWRVMVAHEERHRDEIRKLVD